MEAMKIKNLYDLTQTQAASLLEKAEYPWEVLSEIGAFIKELGETLPEEEYEKRGEVAVRLFWRRCFTEVISTK